MRRHVINGRRASDGLPWDETGDGIIKATLVSIASLAAGLAPDAELDDACPSVAGSAWMGTTRTSTAARRLATTTFASVALTRTMSGTSGANAPRLAAEASW